MIKRIESFIVKKKKEKNRAIEREREREKDIRLSSILSGRTELGC